MANVWAKLFGLIHDQKVGKCIKPIFAENLH